MNIYKQKDKNETKSSNLFSVFGDTRCNVNYINFVVQHSFPEIHLYFCCFVKMQWSQINYVNGCTRIECALSFQSTKNRLMF